GEPGSVVSLPSSAQDPPRVGLPAPHRWDLCLDRQVGTSRPGRPGSRLRSINGVAGRVPPERLPGRVRRRRPRPTPLTTAPRRPRVSTPLDQTGDAPAGVPPRPERPQDPWLT